MLREFLVRAHSRFILSRDFLIGALMGAREDGNLPPLYMGKLAIGEGVHNERNLCGPSVTSGPHSGIFDFYRSTAITYQLDRFIGPKGVVVERRGPLLPIAIRSLSLS